MIGIHINCAVNYIRLNLIHIPSTRHIHIYKHTLIDTRAHTLAHTSTPSHTYNARIHTYIHTYAKTDTCAFTHAHMRTHIHTHTHTHTYTHSHTHSHTCIHTCTHICMHTHACSLACSHIWNILTNTPSFLYTSTCEHLWTHNYVYAYIRYMHLHHNYLRLLPVGKGSANLIFPAHFCLLLHLSFIQAQSFFFTFNTSDHFFFA